MKRISFYILGVFLLFGVAKTATSQVTDICAGTDSVTLRVGNYQYGSIQWQQSTDNVRWEDIVGAQDTVYRFLPERTMYYRAWIAYSSCPADSSQVTRIQLPPSAYSGLDKVLNMGSPVQMTGNMMDDAAGQWTVFSGANATFSDINDGNSSFTGTDTLYRLCWTLTNACGSSSDTVEVRYVTSVFYNAIVVVDTTDIILSDSAERASGLYRIVFSTPVPDITDTTILVGIPYGGFLRRVVYFEYEGDTCKMYTSQASLDDILESGVIHFDAALASQSLRGSGVGNLDHLPTRAELLTDSRFRSGRIWCYEYPIEVTPAPGVSVENFRDNELNVSFNLGAFTFGAGISAIRVSDFHLNLEPNASFLFEKTNGLLDPTIRFGLEYARLHADFKLHLASTLQIPGLSVDLLTLAKRFLFVVGVVPVEINSGFDLVARFNSSATSDDRDFLVNAEYSFSAGVQYEHGVPTPFFSTDLKEVEFEEISSSTDVSLDFALEIGPKYHFKLYECLGPFADLVERISLKSCLGSGGHLVEYSREANAALDIGLELNVFKKSLLELFYRHNFPGWGKRYPYKIAYLSGNQQLYAAAGNTLLETIKVKVFGGKGDEPMQGARVVFQPLDGGTVTNSIVTTDSYGIAETQWSPGDPECSRLEASLQGCNGRHVEGSPIIFHAYSTSSCYASSLELHIDNQNGTLTPRATGGRPPYLYSLAGVTYTSVVPPVTAQPGHAYTMYAKDADGCRASSTYYMPDNYDCDTSSLRLSCFTNGHMVRASVYGGIPPYQFFMDNTPGYPTNGQSVTYNDVSYGTHILSVTDDAGCSDEMTVTVAQIPRMPVVAINRVMDITENSAVVQGIVLDDNNVPITSRGICWSVSQTPTVSDFVSVPVEIGDVGQFSCSLVNLLQGTEYHVRAFATNAEGTSYSEEYIFATKDIPWLHTDNITNVTQHAADVVCTIYSDGNDSITVSGVCWSTSPNPTINDSLTVDGTDTGSFVSHLSGLQRNTTYYVRAYATNGVGTAYGNELSFTTMPIIVPSSGSDVLTTCDDWIYDNGGSSGNYANNSDGYMVVYPAVTGNLVELSGSYQIENGYDNLYVYDGVGISGTLLSTLTGTGTVTSIVSQSGPLTIRFVSDNSLYYSGFALHAQCTSPVVPTVVTASVSNITSSSAVSGGAVTATGGEAVTARGVCWGTSPNPTINGNHTTDGANTGTFVSQITGLSESTTYYVRAYATNSVGTAYGNEVNFTTTNGDAQPCPGAATVTDYDGNIYNTVKIGNQCWMKENLKTTHYTDGSSISQGTTASSSFPYVYYPQNNPANFNEYGLLYNWSAVMHGSPSASSSLTVQGVCPTGWHMPDVLEWNALTTYVNSVPEYLCSSYSSYIAKALSSTVGWVAHSSGTNTCFVGLDTQNNNATGFSAMPAGNYGNESIYDHSYYAGYFGSSAYFWSSRENGSSAHFTNIRNNYSTVDVLVTAGKLYAHSVRCLCDNPSGGSTTNLPALGATNNVVNISSQSAVSGGIVNTEGGAPVVAKGVCWSLQQNPTIADAHTTDGYGCGKFSSQITGLSPRTTYYVRSYATSSLGTVYGAQVSFTTTNGPCLDAPTVTDYDGNVYNTVQIGAQCWMKENLRVLHYSDGGAITVGSLNNTDPRCNYPNGNSSNFNDYGYIYNRVAVMHGASYSETNPSGVQGICPTGWHLPSSSEWSQLADYVNSQSEYLCNGYSGYNAKALADTLGWTVVTDYCSVGNNLSINNKTGFSARPAGYATTTSSMYSTGTYYSMNSCASFWSASNSNATWYLNESYAYMRGGGSHFSSVRCLKD